MARYSTKMHRVWRNLQQPPKHMQKWFERFDVFKAAIEQFEKTTPTRKAFPYMKQWLKLKEAPKWNEQMEGTSQSSGSKRSRNPDATSQQSDG
uniref:Uncharacterized protein n=1 Tax=Lactuca sativa TaxID=4236 RepID=A0A9R1UWM0_LACSA|nr:hypothetical protein LSAT_V11C700375350 [Lactuca sativa]